MQFERFIHKVTPSVLTLFLVLLAASPMHITGAGQLMPQFTLIAIYFWGMFYPGALPIPFLFILGFVQDALSGAPLGMFSFINVSFALLVGVERNVFGKTMFGALWLGFALLTASVLAAQWAVLSFYYGKAMPFENSILQWVTSCLAYPPLHALFTRIYRKTELQ